MSDGICVQCGTVFQYAVKTKKGQPPPPPPPICGFLKCRALQHWGPEEWEGHARMAQARKRANIELDDLDNEALARFPNPQGLL